MSQHTLYSASKSGRWATCAGSLVAGEKAHSRSSEAARRGTGLHWLCDHCLTTGREPQDFDEITFEDHGRMETMTLTEDEQIAAQAAVDLVRGLPGHRLTEIRSDYHDVIGVSDGEGAGTSDVVLVADEEDGTVVEIADFKFGRHFVAATGNTQMLLYAAGIVKALEHTGDTVVRVRMRIIQPFVHNKDNFWEIDAETFAAEIDKLRLAAQRAEEARASFSSLKDAAWVQAYLEPSEEACRYCPIAGQCPKLEAIADEFASGAATLDEFSPMHKPLDSIDPVRMSVMMQKLPLVELYADALRNHAMARLMNREELPGFKLVLGREGNRKYDPKLEPQALVDRLSAVGFTKEQIFAEPKVKTPAQLEKVAKKAKLDFTSVESLIVRNPAKPSITTADDPRSEYVPSSEVDEFGVVA